ncbi:MAG: DUF4177 domain-containing protein [Chloroflexi bacterium]|nr:DUF4177 domain-containing protein [Chloroflexota bacterium]
MVKWEYKTVYIDFPKQQEIRPGQRREAEQAYSSAQAILNGYGEQGWELVSLRPEQLAAFTGSVRWEFQPQTYLAVFKRAKE